MSFSIIERTITCPNGLPAFVAVPETRSPVPGIVLLHERYGLVDHTRDLARRHAREGYACIAGDYFYKHPDQAALHAGEVGYEMTDPEALAYMEDAVAALEALPQVDGHRLAAMGVCQTGRHPIVLAAQRKLAAALCWYGAAQEREWQENKRYPVALDKLIAKINCPVLGIFGETDHIISVGDVRRLRACLETHDKAFHIEIFGGAPHGWLNDTMPGRYRPEQAERAWAVQRAFLTAAFGTNGGDAFTKQSYRAEIGPNYDFSKNVRYE
jgi:carboxymethylenebutenolidase